MQSPTATIHRLVTDQFPAEYHSSLGYAESRGLRLFMQRDDRSHPFISGNKWRKLAALSNIHDRGIVPSCIMSFGGGHSNHLHALGYWCYRRHIPFAAIVRGHYQQSMTTTLRDLIQWNSHLVFVTKQQFSELRAAEFSPSALWLLAAELPVLANAMDGMDITSV